MPAKVEIYTRTFCGYCTQAKHLLQRKNIEFIEISLDQEPAQLEVMLKRSGGKRTVPQIFINDESIGGYDDMWKLDQQGLLDKKLSAS